MQVWIVLTARDPQRHAADTVHRHGLGARVQRLDQLAIGIEAERAQVRCLGNGHHGVDSGKFSQGSLQETRIVHAT
jgi:hypothetical protein